MKAVQEEGKINLHGSLSTRADIVGSFWVRIWSLGVDNCKMPTSLGFLLFCCSCSKLRRSRHAPRPSTQRYRRYYLVCCLASTAVASLPFTRIADFQNALLPSSSISVDIDAGTIHQKPLLHSEASSQLIRDDVLKSPPFCDQQTSKTGCFPFSFHDRAWPFKAVYRAHQLL
jgi:hypothetical protein